MREAGLGCAVCAPPFDRGTLRSNTLRATNSVKSHGGMNHHDAIDSSQCGYQSASPGDQGCPWGSRCERGRPLKSWGPQRSFVRDALSRHALETNGLAQFDCGCAWLCAYLKFYHSPFPPAPFFPPLPFMPFVDGEGWIVLHGRFAVPTEDDGAELAGLSGNRLPNKQSPPAPVMAQSNCAHMLLLLLLLFWVLLLSIDSLIDFNVCCLEICKFVDHLLQELRLRGCAQHPPNPLPHADGRCPAPNKAWQTGGCIFAS